ncbi:MAG: hypothetical protein E6Q97_39425 [Desulfurellales bacterium]|nr:MAG: hypothetical protein E6Q97_39425 [Desulfurellales bacterium]
MQAIQTRYLGPTNSRGSRIKAWCDRGSITIPYPHHLSRGECRTEEAKSNARLIADAPELLAALEECITSEGASCFGDMENHAEWMQRRLYAIGDIARSAIAKAKGIQ